MTVLAVVACFLVAGTFTPQAAGLPVCVCVCVGAFTVGGGDDQTWLSELESQQGPRVTVPSKCGHFWALGQFGRLGELPWREPRAKHMHLVDLWMPVLRPGWLYVDEVLQSTDSK